MCVDYASMWTMLPMLLPMAWTMLPLCCSKIASMAWTMWCFYGLNYAFAYACSYDTSMGHYMWYLVPCNELSLHHRFYTVVARSRFTSCSCHFEWLSGRSRKWDGRRSPPAPPAGDKRSGSQSVAFFMGRARSVLLGKSKSSNCRVTDFFRI
jgi:hypothetical protein